MRGTCSLKTCPARDKRVLRELRMNHRTPNSSSRSLMALESGDCSMCSLSGCTGEMELFGHSQEAAKMT